MTFKNWIKHRLFELKYYREQRRWRKLSITEKEDEWRERHQPFELSFHRKPNMRWNDETFFSQWEIVFGEFMKLDKAAFDANSVLCDVGCGSRPVFSWFTGETNGHFIDPLLDDYIQIDEVREYWSEFPSSQRHSVPAEQCVEELVGQCHFVNCWNVLDHTYDWFQILENIAAYARPDALVCLGTDFVSHGIGHPGIDSRDRFDRFISNHFEVLQTERDFHHRELALKLRRLK